MTCAQPHASVRGDVRPLALALVVLLLSGCGSRGGGRGPEQVAERDWTSGASLLLDGLDDALTRVTNAGVGRLTLRNTSTLYEALLGYTFLGDCEEVLTKLGEPTRRQREVRDELRDACGRLEHASTVFTRAVELDSPRLLASAAREALGTAAQLDRARELLQPLLPDEPAGDR